MVFSTLPKQPHAVVSYLRVGWLLYSSLVLFVLEAYVYGIQLEKATARQSTFWIVFWLVFFLFSFTHIFLVLMDGWSRFQNYKRAKDQFFIHGFHHRIADTYIGSKCQRTAAIVAAEELGIGDTVKAYYATKDIKWYHFIPFFMVQDPFFLFKKKFWSRTFLEKNYTPKFDYRNLELKWQA